MKAVNYSVEQVDVIKSQYAQVGNAGLADIAQAVGKSVKSVRAKLVREGVYVAEIKAPKQAKDEGPSKKELLATLEAKGFDVTGLEGATKVAIERVIAIV